MIPHFRTTVSDEDAAAVAAVVRSGRLSSGEEVAALEADLSAGFGGAEVVAVSSGTAALYLALQALGAPRGGPVIIPSYTCTACSPP